jgi:hypothetical protein
MGSSFNASIGKSFIVISGQDVRLAGQNAPKPSCTANIQCTDPKTPYCNNGKCVECVLSAHCIIGMQFCFDGVCTAKGSPQCIF